ncbi:helix-turn-helix transcriptional regulator [Bosea sp. LjRoot90]|uniref:helix-turn-helix domain-containing protein n=1 Tax=Bosea sp. LjRoot90 TaxID=3342342 RepID=UPI003ED09904
MPAEQIGLIDRHVGARMRGRRKERRISQSSLGVVLGVSYQQVQKYERGLHRIGAGALSAAATLLGVSISYFYEGASTVISSAGFSDTGQNFYSSEAVTTKWRELEREFNMLTTDHARETSIAAVRLIKQLECQLA